MQPNNNCLASEASLMEVTMLGFDFVYIFGSFPINLPPPTE